MTGNNTETHRHLFVISRGIHASLHQLLVPEQRTVIQDGIVVGDSHVVRQPRTRQRHLDIVRQLAFGIDNAVMHEWRRGLIVEEHQLPRALVNLGVRRNTRRRKLARPRLSAQIIQRQWIQPIQITALIKTGEGNTVMHNNISA